MFHGDEDKEVQKRNRPSQPTKPKSSKPKPPTKTRKPTEFAVKYTKKNFNISIDHSVNEEVSFVSIPPILETKPQSKEQKN